MFRHLLAALVCGISATIAGPAAGQDFSIESQVFNGRELTAAGTTIFAGREVFDFLVRPDETVVLNLDEGRIDLLDNDRKVRTVAMTATVEAFCEQLRAKALTAQSEAIRFAANPEFREQIDPETRELTLSSLWLEYRVKPLDPPDAEALRRYEQYLTWQTRLNVMLNPGSPPPGPREALNAALIRRQWMAQEVSLRRFARSSTGGNSLRAEHRFTWRLDEPDLRRIEGARQKMATYQAVPLADYLKAAHR